MNQNCNMDVSVHGAKTQLSKLLDLVEDGESVVIVRHGLPRGAVGARCKRRASALGAMRGQFTMRWLRASGRR